MQEMNQHLAQRLKGLRSELGWSLDVAARETGGARPCWARLNGGVEPDGGHPVEDCHRLSGLLLQLHRADPGRAGEVLYRTADAIRQQPAGEGMQVAPLPL